jgi:hypothetical protein
LSKPLSKAAFERRRLQRSRKTESLHHFQRGIVAGQAVELFCRPSRANAARFDCFRSSNAEEPNCDQPCSRKAEAQLSERSRELYCSANGDSWLLVHDMGNNSVFVRHLPNAPSGGRTQEMDIASFLARGPQGPEHQALLNLIGSLASGTAERTDAPVA